MKKLQSAAITFPVEPCPAMAMVCKELSLRPSTVELQIDFRFNALYYSLMANQSSFWDHPLQTLREAVSIKEQISALEQRLHSLFGGGSSSPGKTGSAPRARTSAAGESVAATPARRRKRKGQLSDAGRARLSAAMKARWAARRAQLSGGSSTSGGAASAAGSRRGKKRRKMSDAARAKISAAAKARWAAHRRNQ